MPKRFAGVAALDRAVEVVPVVEDAALEAGVLGDVEVLDRLAGLEQAEEVERAVKGAGLAL